MSIRIVEHADDKRGLVEAFNQQMREGGSPWGFYVEPRPQWIPKNGTKQSAWREFYLAIDEQDGEGAVVGGFALKPQRWLIHGQERIVTDWQGPFSLGAIDRRYAALGLRMVRDMVKRQPLLYSWGHGSNEEPMVQMLKRMGWLLHETPMLLRVLRPFTFLRKNGYLRQDRMKAFMQDLLAWTGLGPMGVHVLHKARRGASLKRFTATPEVVPTFGTWMDELWERSNGRYDAVALRDAHAMNTLVPAEHTTDEWPEPTRLRIVKGSRVLGMALVLERRLDGDPRFGQLHVGMIADTFGLPEDGGEVVHAAFDFLRDRGVDLVFANQAHPGWIAAYADCGFLVLPGRRLFCASPELEKALEPFDQTRRGLLLSNLDGHGPIL